MTIVMRIRKEFEEPFSAVIKKFAADNYSLRATAQILGMACNTLRVLCKMYCPGLQWARYGELRKECRPCGMNGYNQKSAWPKGKPRHKKQTYTDTDIITMMRQYPNMSCRDFSVMGPCSVSIICRRFGTWNKARKIAGLEVRRKGNNYRNQRD